MKYLDEYRDPDVAARLLDEIASVVTRPWVIMEVCGGQTHSIVRYGIDRLLPDAIELVHGPGCPVCVTALETIDRAHAIAQKPEVIFTSFGDMLRVPGSHGDLLGLKARGADVRVVYSPLDALELARANPRSASRLLRHRIRDHRARQRDGGPHGGAARRAELLDAGLARARAALDRLRDPGARQPRAGLPRAGPRLRGDGLAPVRGDWRNATAHPSSSPGSSRSICSKACCGPFASSRPARRGSRTSTRAR